MQQPPEDFQTSPAHRHTHTFWKGDYEKVYNSNGLADALFCSSSSYLVLPNRPTHPPPSFLIANVALRLFFFIKNMRIFFLLLVVVQCAVVYITVGTSIFEETFTLSSRLAWRTSSYLHPATPHLLVTLASHYCSIYYSVVQLCSLFWSSRRKKKKNQNFEKITRASSYIYILFFLHTSDRKKKKKKIVCKEVEHCL